MSLIRPKGRRYNSREVAKIYRKYPFPSPPPLRRATEIPSGGGVQKKAISEGVGVAYRGFLPGGLSKIGELLINNSFSVEQAISYFTVWPVFQSKNINHKGLQLGTWNLDSYPPEDTWYAEILWVLRVLGQGLNQSARIFFTRVFCVVTPY